MRTTFCFLFSAFCFSAAAQFHDVTTVANMTTPITAATVNTLTNGLVSYWKLDEASGERADSWGTNDLTDNGTVGQVTGKLTSAGNFFGNTRWLSHADDADLSVGASSFTFSTWVNVTNAPASAQSRTILSKYYTLGGWREYGLYWVNSLGSFAFFVSSNNVNLNIITATNAPTTNTWYHLVAWYSTNYNAIYLQVNNGTVHSNTSPNGVVNGGSPFKIGNLNDVTTDYMKGYIDDTMFWKRELTADERSQLYNGGNGLANPIQ